MSDLPEINFQEKKEEKKKGFIPWLRTRLGIGGRNAMGGAGQAASGMRGAGAAGANLGGRAAAGRAAFGAGRFGGAGLGGSASGGLFGAGGALGGLFSGNMGLLLGAAVIAAAVGTGLYLSGSGSPATGTAAFNSNKGADNYVPAIMRQQQGGSSLDMFKDANKDGLADDTGGKYDADGYDKDGYDKDGYDRDGYDKNGFDRDGFDRNGFDKDGYDRNGYDKNGCDRNGNCGGSGAVPPGASGDGIPKLSGSMGGSLTSSLGGGGNKFSNMGGFGNKFNGNKVGFGKVGTGFGTGPLLDSRKKLLAMKGSSRAVMSGKGGANKATTGKGSWGQARGMRSMQKSLGTGGYTIDAARGTQDKAWEGSTPDGTVGGGGTGVSDGGGGGSVSPPVSPYDNPGPGGPGTIPGGDPDPCANGACNDTHVGSDFENTATSIFMMAMGAMLLGYAGAKLIEAGRSATGPWGAVLIVIGVIMVIAAIVMAIMALVKAIGLISSQMWLGIMYTIAAIAVLVGIIACLGGFGEAAKSAVFGWAAVVAGVTGLMGMMMG